MDTRVPTGQIIHQQSPPQAVRFSHGFAKRRAQNVSDWWRSARDRVQILTRERRLGTRGRYISVASLVHFLRRNFLRHKDLTAKEFRKLRWQRLQIFFPRPRVGWNQHPREPRAHTSATLSISEDVTTPIYIFNILNTYKYIYQFVF